MIAQSIVAVSISIAVLGSVYITGNYICLIGLILAVAVMQEKED